MTAAKTKPVRFAPGAMYGYCPHCGAPGARRNKGKYLSRDLCQNGHSYASVDALAKKPKPKKRKRK